MTAEGWRSRGYLPHFDQPGLVQFVTFRLADSLPLEVMQSLAYDAGNNSAADQRNQYEKQLDRGLGACYLRHPLVAKTVEDALLFFDRRRYTLYAWVIMPNHVHVLVERRDGFPIDKIVHSWKSYTANQANKLLDRQGQFWMREYFDRYIRDAQHFTRCVYYIHANPVTANLIADATDWPFSSARFGITTV